MGRTGLFAIPLIASILFTVNANAQQSVVDAINEYGTFDSWSMRQVKESGIIGGETKTLYEFYGDQDTTFTGKTPFSAPKGYLWRTNNVLAIVAGVVKTNNTIYPEKRGDGYCARIETHVEEVKALGVINMDVICQGALIVGILPEPITTTRDPMAKVFYGIPFTSTPKAIAMDIKADVGYETIRGTGFSRLKAMGYPDFAEITVMLQKRWEDENGVVHALRVGTAIWRISEDIPEWVEGYELEINYGDITGEPYYKEYMGLKNDPESAYHALNSRGDNVIIQEDGWAEPGTEPTHLIINIISSCGKAFYGGVGNTLWVDNVRVVM
ncbi:MAG: PCMD domain-containing protein [Bacteroidales bacterium]|nr:PCMD domain-containing protein [Bacteroidales bacterium]